MPFLRHRQLVGFKGNGTVSVDYILLAVQVAKPASSLKLLISWIQFIFLDKRGEVNESITAAAVALHDDALLVLPCWTPLPLQDSLLQYWRNPEVLIVCSSLKLAAIS